MKLLENWYLHQSNAGKLVYDAFQLDILQQLDIFITNFNNQGFFTRLLHKPPYLGYYIYGSVGRGKSMILNEVYKKIAPKSKIRIHFHQFMQNIHQQLAKLKDKNEPLQVIAKQLKQKYSIILLDEMHVSDIATAMILKNLFTCLFNNGIYLITSSNYSPDELYLNGLMRERFLPAISLIKQKLKVLCLDSPKDYRLLHPSFNQLFFINQDNNHDRLNYIFDNIRQQQTYANNEQITIQSRKINFVKKAQDIIWFDFTIICGNNRSQLDYLELIKTFNWFIIENIYALSESDKDMARRFTWLIDILYDNQCKLALSCNVALNNIYPHGDFANEFTRTISRLMEMQTKEYLNQNKS